jgi:hypothetical protein
MESTGVDNVLSTFNQNTDKKTEDLGKRRRRKGTAVRVSTGRLFMSLPQIVWPVQRKRHKFLVSNLSASVRNRKAIGKTVGHTITNKTHPDHRRCQKLAPLLCTHCLQLNKMFTFMRWSSLVENRATILNSVCTSRRTGRRIFDRLSHIL